MDVLRTLDRQLDVYLGLKLEDGSDFDNREHSRDRKIEMERERARTRVDMNSLTPGRYYSFIAQGHQRTVYFICELPNGSLVFSSSTVEQIRGDKQFYVCGNPHTLVVDKSEIPSIVCAANGMPDEDVSRISDWIKQKTS
jgi:hypothetical protein